MITKIGDILTFNRDLLDKARTAKELQNTESLI